jgi:hypothetical protein
MSNKEKYFVCSHSEEPEVIYFNKEDAFKTGINYVDSFDNNGKRIASYKYVSDGEYTTDF